MIKALHKCTTLLFFFTLICNIFKLTWLKLLIYKAWITIFELNPDSSLAQCIFCTILGVMFVLNKKKNQDCPKIELNILGIILIGTPQCRHKPLLHSVILDSGKHLLFQLPLDYLLPLKKLGKEKSNYYSPKGRQKCQSCHSKEVGMRYYARIRLLSEREKLINLEFPWIWQQCSCFRGLQTSSELKRVISSFHVS